MYRCIQVLVIRTVGSIEHLDHRHKTAYNDEKHEQRKRMDLRQDFQFLSLCALRINNPICIVCVMHTMYPIHICEQCCTTFHIFLCSVCNVLSSFNNVEVRHSFKLSLSPVTIPIYKRSSFN